MTGTGKKQIKKRKSEWLEVLSFMKDNNTLSGPLYDHLLPSSMQVMPSDHTSTFPSYCPSSMARITSGAILHTGNNNSTAIQAFSSPLFDSGTTKSGSSRLIRFKHLNRINSFIYSNNITSTCRIALLNYKICAVQAQPSLSEL